MTVRYDVAVVGGGLAGAAAAAAAAESGASVLLLEKTATPGGSTVLSSGLNAYAGTDEQAAAGVADDVELLRRDLLETGRHRNDPSLVDAYCREQLGTYRWLRSLGVEFGAPRAASGQSVPRSHPVDTAAAIETLLRLARGRGARIRLGCAAERPVVTGGRVGGLRVRSRDGEEHVEAGAVVLATGGFSRSPALLARFAPGMEKAIKAGGAGSTGDGLRMACSLGAGLADLPYIKATFGVFPWPSSAEEGHGLLAVYKGAVAVNGLGERFTDESLPYKEIGDACLAQPEGVAFQIFDAPVLDLADPQVPIYDFAPRLRAGQIQRADTLAGLADGLGIPGDRLQASVDAYNTAIATGGPDPFGRRTLSGDVGTPRPIGTPPYYGYPSTAVMLATYGGVTVDADTRVLDVYGDPIPGLFAAGEVTGGFHGAGYVTGTSLGKSAIFGRLAGAGASEESAP
ncbi:FAD-dependent oxidoreductase [Actinomadura sp. WMMB 499]|uniref:FAD-dependent oxidoreductase n=1 Tax=Actinomadura sp. WMMB 499 TaxID=1219491 RepID=UPI001244434C|nr:FAD-dependent oxidoreductase [Actinomadura sp. WMMB 499]QFG20091.1 FAD-dependent oxidoreductase [Actinomadura sp. WMMB 499]